MKKKKIHSKIAYAWDYLQIQTRRNLDSTNAENPANRKQIRTRYEKRYSA